MRLFLTADKSADGGSTEKLGNGILFAAAALGLAPADADSLQKTPADQAGFPFLNVLSSTGLTASAADQMLQLEATQLVQRWDCADIPNPLELAVADPDRRSSDVAADKIRNFLEIVSEHPQASRPLKKRPKEVLDGMTGSSGILPQGPPAVPAPPPAPSAGATVSMRSNFSPPAPPYRKLRGYSVDPSLTTALDTVGIGEVTFKIPWEPLKPGPVGEYLEVMDLDPASKSFYKPVDLDAPVLLAQDGLPPSEGVPQFHQQMTYAVSSLTIQNFEKCSGAVVRALGRQQWGQTPRTTLISSNACESIPMRCARPMPTTRRTKSRCSLAISMPRTTIRRTVAGGKGIHMPFA